MVIFNAMFLYHTQVLVCFGLGLGLGGIVATFSVTDAVDPRPDRTSIVDALDRLPHHFVVSSLFEPGLDSMSKSKPTKS